MDLYKYVVYFQDKEGSSGSLEQPGEFMSEKSLERRGRYSIPVSYTDLPLSSDYLSQLEDNGFELHGKSRWLNAVLIYSPDTLQLSDFEDLDFVRKVQFVSKELAGGRTSLEVKYAHQMFWTIRPDLEYGVAANQIRMLNGQFLHKNGFRGEGMTIAVLDAGFINADNLEAFADLYSSNRVIATYDVVDGGTGVYEVSGHGTNVLSTMAGDIPGTYLGTAPDANYILIRTEDAASEQLVEEFNYVLGLEYADQMGADLVNTSLGYTRYNYPEMDHEPNELTGDALIASQGADLAASKGIFVVNSAGNEGSKPWQYISIPSDGDSVLAVGSVNAQGDRSPFSGQGWPGSGNIKPNVMSQGEGAAVVSTTGEVGLSNGTSFSSPILTGLISCLWQAFPERNNMEILQAIERSSSQYLAPDLLMGNGIPDMQAAYALLFQGGRLDHLTDIQVFPNPFNANLTLTLPDVPNQDMIVSLVNDMGQELFNNVIQSGSRKTVNLRFNGVQGLQSGLYFLKIKTKNDVLMFKLIKV
ncbi:MAG: S8 family serine peptidase [Bacteroidetes bacterium]|nr:S8 family serine peptidase [Bacteroidota bacterium]